MKFKLLLTIPTLFLILSCTDLDLNPLSEGSSENWYSNEMEFNMAVYDLYRHTFWPLEDGEWSDDYMRRQALTPITSATINGEWETAISWWGNSYKVISRANKILMNLDKVKETLPQETVDKFAGNAHFVRASQYSKLIFYFGDVVHYTGVVDLDEAFTMGRTAKQQILETIYADYDSAVLELPLSYGSAEIKLATKGAALAMKARIALAVGDWAIARDAAKTCIDLGVYELYPDFGKLFLAGTKNTKELIFGLPRSKELGIIWEYVNYFLPRNNGGYGGSIAPSWDLFCSFLCSDGLPIDESLLYNPREPFKNRDPRCTATIVEFGTPFLGYRYQPHPDSLTTLNLNTGKYVKNNDTRGNQTYASFNGLVWKKFTDESWLPDFQAENDKIIIRYADVLLMYAEAKIELNEINQSVLDAINMVRARAYQVNYGSTSLYPAVTTTSQADLRTVLRVERRMEFAHESLRYWDIIRWKIAEKVLNQDIYGMLDVAELRTKIVNKGLWFLPSIPEIDENGSADLLPMYQAGLIKRLADRQFDASKQYLWPIPSKEILINGNLEQNPGY